MRRSVADPDPYRRLTALHQLFYTDAWPHGPEESNLLGDPTMTSAESRAHLRASARHDAWEALPRITAPTLVFRGTDDHMVPTANAPLLAERVPDADLHLIQGGRHGFFEEYRHEVVPVIRDFLA